MILNLPAFIAIATFYALCGAGLVRYLWICRTPMAASVHRLQIPKLDPTDDWPLSGYDNDVGWV